jgi:predicted molibdopterin-dependent oxidoreductase YjgC
MTGRSSLEDAYPEATCEIHPGDAEDLGLEEGDWVEVSSRRGSVKLRILVTGRSPKGTIFIPFHFAEAAANALTLDKVDEKAKIPDYKNTAVKIEKTSPPEDWGDDYNLPLVERGVIKDPVQIH